jgi:hypothetical protein
MEDDPGGRLDDADGVSAVRSGRVNVRLVLQLFTLAMRGDGVNEIEISCCASSGRVVTRRASRATAHHSPCGGHSLRGCRHGGFRIRPRRCCIKMFRCSQGASSRVGVPTCRSSLAPSSAFNGIASSRSRTCSRTGLLCATRSPVTPTPAGTSRARGWMANATVSWTRSCPRLMTRGATPKAASCVARVCSVGQALTTSTSCRPSVMVLPYGPVGPRRQCPLWTVRWRRVVRCGRGTPRRGWGGAAQGRTPGLC